MPANEYTLRELQWPGDPLLVPWLELYETAFPPDERILVARIVRVLQNPQLLPGARLRAAVGADGGLLGLAYSYEPPEQAAAFLWYMAVVAQTRGQGVGAWLYNAVLGCLPGTARAMIFDVEDPRHLPAETRRSMAERRIGFYRRQGARLLGSVRYMQRIGSHLDPLPMRLMAQPIDPAVTAREAYDLALPVYGAEALSLDGEPYWE